MERLGSIHRLSMRRVLWVFAILNLLIQGRSALAQCPELGWKEIGGGVNGTIHAMVEYDDGSGPVIVIGGEFTMVGGNIPANRIATWDGTNWGTFGSGASHSIYSLAVYNDGTGPALYVGGDFTSINGVTASRIAKRSGTTWSALGTGANGTVRVILGDEGPNGPALYIGGDFTTSGGITVNRIAKWNGSVWSALGTGVNNSVLSLALFNDGDGESLFVGGSFSTAGGKAAGRIARWNATTWSPLGAGSSNGNPVRAMAKYDDGTGLALYAGGSFTIGDVTTNLARWDGQAWGIPGVAVLAFTNPTPGIRAIACYEHAGRPLMFVAGVSQVLGDATSYGRVALWDGNIWTNLTSAYFNGLTPLTLMVSDMNGESTLYGGGVSGIGPAQRLLAWQPVASFTNRNHNSLDDGCELHIGLASDCNANGIPDHCEASFSYALDNGSWWIYSQSVSRDWLWINNFNIAAGHETITHVALPASPFVPDGWAFTVLLYSDPNQDGNPDDAVLLASTSEAHFYGGWRGDSTFVRVPIQPTRIGDAGTSFFVGAVSYSGLTHAFTAIDTDLPNAQRSWHKYGPDSQPGALNFSNLSEGNSPVLFNFPNYGNFVIRALSLDCNANGVWDECDIEQGVSLDLNANGIPDECEPKPLPCVADIAPPGGDGSVGVPDLLAVIANWGSCAPSPPPCFADIAPPGGDGTVGVPDLLAVIANWGPCE